MEDIALRVASNAVKGQVALAVKYLVAPVDRHCGYVIFTDRYVRQLFLEFENLHTTRADVQRSIGVAANNMKLIKCDVEEWMKEVDDVVYGARDVLYYGREARKTCFYGWLPNPHARYHLGKRASRMVKDVQKLILRAKFKEVYSENPPPALVDDVFYVNWWAGDGGDFITDSRASIFQGIIKALNDEKVKVVGVYGPGGVGKTTLLEIVEKKLRQDGRPFRMIVKAEVSRTPDLNNIQSQIADALSLNLKDRECQQGRRDLLFQRLQRDPSEKVLIILDDLWGALDLKAVGIPSGDKSMNCKLLLTSRDKRVLEQRMHADQTFHMTSLEEDEAFKLFEKIVGDKLREDEELKVKAAQVVTKLAGLPLLINSVASTLKCSDVSTWEDMLIKIEDPHNERIVKWSYDHLESEEAKCLFLLCGLIGGTIRVELLLGLGMSLGLFGGFDNKMQSSRNRLNTMLKCLHSFCLLQDGGDGKENVTIHDLYSEVVVSDVFSYQISLMINNNHGSWAKEKLEKCWACLVNVGSDRLAELMLRRFSHVKILMLSEQYDMGDCSRMDFTYMGELRVLYLGSMHITSLPSSMEILRNLQSLSISCHVEDVANLGKLKALQILSFVGSEISKLPKELGKLTNLRSLNLSNCYSLEIIEPGALKDLINLEELHMKGSFDQWRGEHELAELKSLTKLASLEISISDPMILLKDGDLPFEKLEKFWINVGDVEAREYEGLMTMKLNLEGRDSILSRKWVKKNLQKTQFLYLSNLSEFKERPRELCTQGFQEVKYLDIKDSPSIKYIADSSNAESSNDLPAFGKLESLFLEDLINLEKICHGPIAPKCFNKLKAVRVGQCDQLKYLWCLSNIKRLVQLEEIKVWNCDSMQSIVIDDTGEDIVSTSIEVVLPNVRDLVLHKLPNMTSFCDTSIQVSLPHLESLVIDGLLGLEKILYNELLLKYNNLRSLRIEESKSTSKSILKLDWIMAMPALESLSLGSFPSAEVVFDLEELKVTGDVESCSRLMKLTLAQLPNLQHMWKWEFESQGTSIFRNLRDLFVYKTGQSFLFSVSMAKCFREIRAIRMWECPNMKAVIVDEEGRNEGTYDIIEFSLLEHLSIRGCPMEKFFSYLHGKKEPVTTTSDLQDAHSDSFFDRKVTFPNITVLEIDGLQCKELWNDQIPTDSFQKLESLKLENCDNLRRIAPPQMWKVLQHCLKNLEVISCHLIKIIYEGHGMDTEGGELRELLLRDLENMEHIWQSEDLPNVPFPNLIDVEAVRCPRLIVLFTTFTAKFLGQIKELGVSSCKNMKLIGDQELGVESCEDMKLIGGHEKGEERTGTTVTFSKLTVLSLFELPNFSGFLPGNYLLEFIDSKDHFPSLEVYNIRSCGAWDRICGDWTGYKRRRECRRDFVELDWFPRRVNDW